MEGLLFRTVSLSVPPTVGVAVCLGASWARVCCPLVKRDPFHILNSQFSIFLSVRSTRAASLPSTDNTARTR